jgi:hydroxymethylpyrimidine/phosphomethylpyrimidine kinase
MSIEPPVPPAALTIAGSDSCSGAGIQADLKTFTALNVYGCTVLTAITAQNTQEVRGAEEVSPHIIEMQMDAILADIPIHSAKSGMLSSVPIIEAVAGKISHYAETNYVLDPVMVAKSGDLLLNERAIDAIKSLLFPLALVVTPNRFEAEKITGIKIGKMDDAKRAADKMLELGAQHVVVKGGSAEPDAADIIASSDTDGFRMLGTERIATHNDHGSGCTFSAAIAAYLARGKGVPEAIRLAKVFVTEALRHSYPIGKGRSPLNHFWNR